jgi:hypothetical protein
MAHFDLSQYQTVQERVDLFWERYPQGRFNLDIITVSEQQVIIKAEVWTDWAEDKPRAVDYAEERFGSSPVNKTSFIENCASSALGRAISQLGGNLSPKGKRPSASEMEKVNRINNRDWLKEAEDLSWKEDLDGLRALFVEASRLKASEDVLNKIKDLGNGHKGSKDTAK